MAQCKLTPQEFISNTFSPQVAAVCSTAAENTCQKNNLTFIELIQPFCKLNAEGYIKDPQGTTVTVRNLRVSIQDVNTRPPQPTLARKMLNESVSSSPCERTTTLKFGTTNLDIPVAVPWFESWREMFLNVQFPSDHEFTQHFLACMIIVSTADDNPLEKIQHMGAQLYQSIPGKLPKWFNNNTLRYYILIHDTSQDDRSKAETVFNEMKNIYGANNCFLLQMNSRPPGPSDDSTHLPDPWCQFLTKHSDLTESNEQSSSPRTPADTGGVSAMPNQVTMEQDRSSLAGTPIAPRNPMLGSPDLSDTISLSSDISESINGPLEVGQEAVSVSVHPLSPENDKSYNFVPSTMSKNKIETDTPINDNVWADSPSQPSIQHGVRLSSQDLERLRTLVTEFCIKSLLPYVEKQISQLNDVISNKKGVSRSIFSATKRWFVTNKPGAPGSAPANAVIYTVESPELQLRRLGDLCFMFGHYSLAYHAYHSAKRDFAADQAWLYYAGALEMAALSAFMQGEMTRKSIEYMDDAILTYLNSCKMPQFATRATLLSAECLKGRSLYGEAAKQLIRMTSEDSDLRSALLLEQAAYCFVSSKMMRKYAFHAVLAGHRFSKAGQRKHSLRCYQQAYQVYQNRDWSLAEDHIHFTIGRQAASLKQVEDAAKAFEKLLNASSKQPATQQAAFLREYLHTQNLLFQEEAKASHDLPILPLPLINTNVIKVLFGHLVKIDKNNTSASYISFDSDDIEDIRWSKLEEILLTEAQGSPPMIFKPTVALYSDKSNNSSKPNAVLNEPVHFSIELHNPLHIPLPLSNAKLLWSFEDNEQEQENKINVSSNSDERRADSESETQKSPVEAQSIEAIVLQPDCTQRIVLSLVPKRIGQLKVLGMSYNLSNPNHTVADQPVVNPGISIAGKRLFELKGPKLKNVKERPGAQMYGEDYRLEMNVVEGAPFAQLSFSKLSSEMLCGEMQRVEVTLKNIGNAPLTNIYVGSNDPKVFSLENHPITTNNSKTSGLVTKIHLPPSTNGILNVGETYKMPLWVRAPHDKGTHRLDLMFYYENSKAKSIPKYRLSRHTWQLTVLDSIQISATVRQSGVSNDDLPTLNLIVQVKNTNQVHDPFINEISLTKVSLKSESWMLSKPTVLPLDRKIQPQEILHFFLKLKKKNEDTSEFSDVALSEDKLSESITQSPYIDFIQRRKYQALNCTESQNDMQQQQNQLSQKTPLSETRKVDSTIILRWRGSIMEGGVPTRQAIGQHHVDIDVLNKTYKHPDEKKAETNEYDGHLRIFGPDRNVADSTSVIEKDEHNSLELQQNVVIFALNHVRQVAHNFKRSRLCVIPVQLRLQNTSNSRVDVKINTIGTSSKTQLPSIKSQLYSPQGSTFFRYTSHTAVNCYLEPYACHLVMLQALLATPGTYDLASRVEVSVKVDSNNKFTPQKWRLESVCIVSDDSL